MKKLTEEEISYQAGMYASNRVSQGYYKDKLNAFEAGVHWAQERLLQQTHVMQPQSGETLPGDAVEFIANALGEEVKLRQMIDLWCIDQLGNTDEALEKADAMFAAARDIFYRSGNGA